MISEITKPASRDELTMALKQRGWKFLESCEVVNRDDVRDLHLHTGTLVSRGKKLPSLRSSSAINLVDKPPPQRISSQIAPQLRLAGDSESLEAA